MGITAIVSGIFAVAKAVPYVFQVISLLSGKLIDLKVSRINAQRVTKENQRDALLKAILRAKTNEEIVAHSVTLHQLNNGGILREPNSK